MHHLVISILNHSQARNVHPAVKKSLFASQHGVFFFLSAPQWASVHLGEKQEKNSWLTLAWTLTLFLISKWKKHTSFQTLVTVCDRVHIAVVQNCLLLFTSVFWRICTDFLFPHKGKHEMGWRVWVGDVWKKAYGGFNWRQRSTTTHQSPVQGMYLMYISGIEAGHGLLLICNALGRCWSIILKAFCVIQDLRLARSAVLQCWWAKSF